MNITNEVAPQPKPEKPTKAKLFEHLFPGNRWDSLIPFNPLNVPGFTKRLMWDVDITARDFGQAVQAGQGFARRIDLHHPDKITVGFGLLDTEPTPEKPKYGTVSDLMEEGEQLGGMGIRPMSWLKDEVVKGGVTTFVPAVMNQQVDIYNHGIAKVVGVLGKDKKPKAVIVYRDGRRPRKGIREPVTAGAPGGVILQPAHVAI